MRVAKLILVVEPGTGRISKLVPIQHSGLETKTEPANEKIYFPQVGLSERRILQLLQSHVDRNAVIEFLLYYLAMLGLGYCRNNLYSL